MRTRTRFPTDKTNPPQKQVNVRVEERLLHIQKLQLFVPRDTENGANMLNKQAQRAISEQLKKTEEMKVARSIASDPSDSEWGEHQALVDELLAKLHEDYGHIVLGEEFSRTHRTEVHIAQRTFFETRRATEKTEADIVARRKKR